MSESISSRLNPRARWPVFIGMCLLAATIIYPLFFVVATSLRTNVEYKKEPFSLSGPLSIDNYITLWNEYGVGRAFANSMFVSLVSVTLVLAFSSLAGYALAKLPVFGHKLFNATFVSVMLIPGPVLIIPIYLVLAKLGIVGDYEGLILVYVATGLPFAIFFLTLTFRAIPDELLEAARVDGAGFFRTLWSIVGPMGASGIATLAVLQFLGIWNELIFALILIPDAELKLLTPTLASIGKRFVSDQPLTSAGLFITAVVPLLILAFASKYIMRGLQVGLSR